VEIAPDRSLRLTDVAEPALRPGEVRVAVAFCGICGTDLQMLGSPALPAGSVMGHELTGEVVELGAEVDGWAVGDSVSIFPFAPCGRCGSCVAGNEQICAGAPATGLGLGVNAGGYAETVVVQASMLRRLPDAVSLEHGALVEPLAVALHAVAVSGLDPAAPVAVTGAGPIGALTAIALRARGFARIAAIEPNRRRRELLEALGFPAVDPDNAGKEEFATLGLGGDAPVGVFECSGSRTAPQLALELLAPGGRIMLLSTAARPARLPLAALLVREIQLRPSFAYNRSEFEQALELLAAGDIPADRLITSIVPLSEAPAMFDELCRSDTRQLKVLLRP
jgi:2-desacetyl-2-hydroxyethyl bacteriochlorophyllide A dehydrogenase